jgi:hypothetical protein
MPRGICRVDGCGRPVKARGVCNAHYLRWHKGQDVDVEPERSKTCSVEGCERQHYAHGICAPHYKKLRKYGDAEFLHPRFDKRTCSVDGCDRPHGSVGLCDMHYARKRKTGTTADRVRPSVADRLWSRVDKNGPISEVRPDLGRCWIWTGGRSKAGYGAIFANGRNSTHRVAYELSVGPIPKGLTIDHLCFVLTCVNPAHLEAVTNEENARRAAVRRWAQATD